LRHFTLSSSSSPYRGTSRSFLSPKKRAPSIEPSEEPIALLIEEIKRASFFGTKKKRIRDELERLFSSPQMGEDFHPLYTPENFSA